MLCFDRFGIPLHHGAPLLRRIRYYVSKDGSNAGNSIEHNKSLICHWSFIGGVIGTRVKFRQSTISNSCVSVVL